jgi:alpha,alpha-trehalose phosphorylase
MMATGATVESNIELVRDYTRRVFNEHNPELAAEFVTPDVKFLPWNAQLRVHPQSEGLTEHERWDFSRTPVDGYPLLLHFP